MGDAEDKSRANLPERPKAQEQLGVGAETHEIDLQPATLEQARRFLRDPEVQKENLERKAEFLASKGVSQSDIEGLLEIEAPAVKAEAPISNPVGKQPEREPRSDTATTEVLEKREDRPPIITYPEFLTKPVRPPPLVTANGFLNTIYAFGGFSTLVYGMSKYLLEPMVQSLTEARISLHGSAKEDLTKLIDKLETVVSELPPAAKKADLQVVPEQGARDDDEKSSYDDPTELFHRDIGIQTSLPSSPSSPPSELAPPEPPCARQARRLTELVSSVKAVGDGLVEQQEELSDIKSLLGVFRDELDRLSLESGAEWATGYSGFSASRNEPDDEIKKAKENIRRVKGVLLSTRSFPASIR